MAPLVLAMLFIGLAMVTTLSSWHQTLLMVHRPLGIALFVLVLVRLIIRITHKPPSLAGKLPLWQRALAHASHWVFYGLLIAMPLIGWGMLSAGGFPVVMGGAITLPAILPINVALYALLRSLHTYCAILLLLTFCGHLAAALYHGLICRDGIFTSMAKFTPVKKDQ
jgi:cytochrome b561